MPQTCAWISPIGGKFELAETLFDFSVDCANADAAMTSDAINRLRVFIIRNLLNPLLLLLLLLLLNVSGQLNDPVITWARQNPRNLSIFV